jgi:hypothetical protein
MPKKYGYSAKGRSKSAKASAKKVRSVKSKKR